jgi:hypothetical protein
LIFSHVHWSKTIAENVTAKLIIVTVMIWADGSGGEVLTDCHEETDKFGKGQIDFGRAIILEHKIGIRLHTDLCVVPTEDLTETEWFEITHEVKMVNVSEDLKDIETRTNRSGTAQ